MSYPLVLIANRDEILFIFYLISDNKKDRQQTLIPINQHSPAVYPSMLEYFPTVLIRSPVLALQ